MNYFALLSKDGINHLCDDFKWRTLETAVAHDCLMTFSSRRAAQEYADAHELHAEPVDLRDLTHPEAIEGIENYLSI